MGLQQDRVTHYSACVIFILLQTKFSGVAFHKYNIDWPPMFMGQENIRNSIAKPYRVYTKVLWKISF